MERWEYLEILFSADGRYLYFYPEEKIDVVVIKQAFKNRGEFTANKDKNEMWLYLNDYHRSHSSLLLALNILGQGGWEAFSASDSEHFHTVLLKRHIE